VRRALCHERAYEVRGVGNTRSVTVWGGVCDEGFSVVSGAHTYLPKVTVHVIG